MKTSRVFLLMLLAFLGYMSCAKTSTEPDNNNDNGSECTPNFPEQEVTYNGYVKNILNTYCISCHGGAGPGPGDFRTYQGVLAHTAAFKIRVLPDNADMPMGNAPLPQHIRDSLAVWIGNCTPEN